MTPLEATVALMQNWAVTGLLKGQTPEQLRGEALLLYTGLQGATMAPKTRRKAKTPETAPQPAKPVHIDMNDPAIKVQAPLEEKDDDSW